MIDPETVSLEDVSSIIHAWTAKYANLCEQLAAAVEEQTRLIGERDALAAALEELHKRLLDEEDILDGPEPGDPPRPNWAMRADMLLGQILERRECDPTSILSAYLREQVKPLVEALGSIKRLRVQTAEAAVAANTAIEIAERAISAWHKQHPEPPEEGGEAREPDRRPI